MSFIYDPRPLRGSCPQEARAARSPTPLRGSGSILATLASLPLIIACGGDDADATADANPMPDAAGDRDGGADFDLELQRSGTIRLVEGGGYESVLAILRDKPELPAPTLLASDGASGCRIYVHDRPPLCDPPCEGGVCVGTGASAVECQPFPIFVSAGDIAVTGLTSALTFVPGVYGYTPEPPTGEDLFADGAAITASAPGDDGPGFTLEARGVSSLEATFPTTLELEDDVDEVIAWTAPADPDPDVRIALGLRVGHHGSSYEAMLLCETDDDGELTVPGALITQLPRASSKLEQHFSFLLRYSRDVVETAAGPVDFVVGSQVIILQISH